MTLTDPQIAHSITDSAKENFTSLLAEIDREWDKKKSHGVDVLDEMAKYTYVSKYARYKPDAGRREVWDESVQRVLDMHLNKFADSLSDGDLQDIVEAFELVKQKKVLPSMRAMQFGGNAVESNSARIYNCATRHINSIRSFAESFFLLLSGCGVGFGLSERFLGQLPDLVSAEDKTGTVLTYVIEDTLEGWADSVEALLSCYFKGTAFSGRKIVFDYSKIRPAGAPLVTSGGKAPGHEGLKAGLTKIKTLMDHIIEDEGHVRLKTIHAYDILMHIADCVLSGGIRRAATAVIFQPDDMDMMKAKTGDWFIENPQRGRSNNSVILDRKNCTLEQFKEIVETAREFGEPGFVFSNMPETQLYNPCFEIALCPIDSDGVPGVQFCNLTSLNWLEIEDEEDFRKAAHAAALIGTLQASYTDFPYLNRASKNVTEEEALLGVSMTGMMAKPDLAFNTNLQEEVASLVVEVNKEWADKIGINQAARTTCIKPEGTSSIVVGSMFSGIHPAHSEYMFRRIQANKLDNVYRHFNILNSHATEPSKWSANGTDDVVTFPIKNSPDAFYKEDLTAEQHLDLIKSTQKHWVAPGTTEVNKKDMEHNVSCTVVVQEDEWDFVAEYLFKNRELFSAVSLLAATGDKDFEQAPNEQIRTVEDAQRFLELLQNFSYVDYSLMNESTDNTSLGEQAACAGPQGCEVF